MACTLSNKCAKNLSKRTVLLQLIIKNVVTCFFWNTVQNNCPFTRIFGIQVYYYYYYYSKCTLFTNVMFHYKVTFILGDFNFSYGLTQFVKQSTRDNNILDLVLSTSVKIISNIDILPPIGTSDHNVIVFLILIQLTLSMSITLLTIHSLIGHMLTMI